MFTKTQDGKFTQYEFEAGGYKFLVLWSPTGYWMVYREERGHQLRHMGKTFWDANKMIAHYKTAAVQLGLIAADARNGAWTPESARARIGGTFGT